MEMEVCGAVAGAMAKRHCHRTKKEANATRNPYLAKEESGSAAATENAENPKLESGSIAAIEYPKLESGSTAAIEYPPVTENEYGLICPYLERWPLEDEEEANDSMYFSDDDRPDNVEGAHEVTKRFLKQVRESRGYDVDCFPPECICSPFIPRHLSDETLLARATEVTKFAIDHINAETVDKVGKRYHFQSVEKVVGTRTLMMLLTFTVKEVDAVADIDVNNAQSPLKTVQAMVWAPYHADHEFMEWRFKPGCG